MTSTSNFNFNPMSASSSTSTSTYLTRNDVANLSRIQRPRSCRRRCQQANFLHRKRLCLPHPRPRACSYSGLQTRPRLSYSAADAPLHLASVRKMERHDAILFHETTVDDFHQTHHTPNGGIQGRGGRAAGVGEINGYDRIFSRYRGKEDGTLRTFRLLCLRNGHHHRIYRHPP